MDSNLKIVLDRLEKATCPEDIFGALAGKSPEEQISAIKKQFHYLIRYVHPDKHQMDLDDPNILNGSFTKLKDFFSMAKDLVEAGTYGSGAAANTSGTDTHGADTPADTLFEAKGYQYHIQPHKIEGDFCDVYLGRRTKDGSSEDICLKIIRERSDNPLIANESDLLKKLSHKSVPVFLDHLVLEDKREANVMKAVDKSYDLYSIRENFPDGLTVYHTTWVMERALSVLGYLHSQNVVHGSIEPGNLMITPHNHNVTLIDFLLAIPEANKKGSKYKGTNGYSAPEISKTAHPHPASDMYSLGKSIVMLLGGKDETVPRAVDMIFKRFLSEFLEDDPTARKDDAWKAYHEIREIRTRLYGIDRKFVELEMLKEI